MSSESLLEANVCISKNIVFNLVHFYTGEFNLFNLKVIVDRERFTISVYYFLFTSLGRLLFIKFLGFHKGILWNIAKFRAWMPQDFFFTTTLILPSIFLCSYRVNISRSHFKYESLGSCGHPIPGFILFSYVPQAASSPRIRDRGSYCSHLHIPRTQAGGCTQEVFN